MYENTCNFCIVKGALSNGVLTACGKVATACLSVPALHACWDNSVSQLRQARSPRCPESNITHSDNASVQATSSDSVHRRAH